MAEIYVKHLPVGTKLQNGKYEIVRFINSGGFGCTYEAFFPLMRTRVAIKEFFMGKFCIRDQATGCVEPSTEDNRPLIDRSRQKFLDEATMLFSMSHRSIVRVSDIFEENGTAYFVMDYISGRTLAEIVRDDGPMPEQKVIDCMRQICDALQYLHGNSRLHLDIKPDNIMIDDAGRAVLIDFGASKYIDYAPGEEKRVTSNVVQTPGYSPNEQLTGDLSRFTNATDLYALGATMYYVLSGVTPVSATLRSAGEELEPLPQSVSQSTRDAVDKAMRLPKSERPQTAIGFCSMLKDAPAMPAPAKEEVHFERDKKTEPLMRKVAPPAASPSIFDIPQKPVRPRPVSGKRKAVIGAAAGIGAVAVTLISVLIGGRGEKTDTGSDTLALEAQARVEANVPEEIVMVPEEKADSATYVEAPQGEAVVSYSPEDKAPAPIVSSRVGGSETVDPTPQIEDTTPAEPTPEQLLANELHEALKLQDLRSRHAALLALADKKYAPAYAPLASVSVLLADDTGADMYARLAIQHGHASEVSAVVNALDKQGYYDNPAHGKKPL